MIRRGWTRFKRLYRVIFKRGPRWWYVSIAVIVLTGVVVSYLFWESLHSEQDSLSATISNLSLVLGGTVAIVLAVWRSKVSERQTDVAQRQAETVQRDMLNQQLLKGAEMLGSSSSFSSPRRHLCVKASRRGTS